MKAFGLNELREMFLQFFESKGHLRLPSFSLVPQNDPSLLLINSGMAPMKPYFTGEQTPPRKRVCTCQKCVRTGDIENIGKTARHGTFFEMLGNFSFGDYFKHEAIAWCWEFLTSPEWVGMDPDRLYPSVYEHDDEAFNIWRDEIGIALDFKKLKSELDALLAEYDHTNLSELPEFQTINPTSENLARTIYRKIGAKMNGGSIQVHRVRIGESDHSAVTYFEE